MPTVYRAIGRDFPVSQARPLEAENQARAYAEGYLVGKNEPGTATVFIADSAGVCVPVPLWRLCYAPMVTGMQTLNVRLGGRVACLGCKAEHKPLDISPRGLCQACDG